MCAWWYWSRQLVDAALTQKVGMAMGPLAVAADVRRAAVPESLPWDQRHERVPGAGAPHPLPPPAVVRPFWVRLALGSTTVGEYGRETGVREQGGGSPKRFGRTLI